MGGRGPPGGVTGQALSARLGWAEPAVELLPTEPLDDGVFELPIEQAAVPSTRHPIRTALRTLRLAPGTPVPEDGTESTTSSTSSSRCLTLPVSPYRLPIRVGLSELGVRPKGFSYRSSMAMTTRVVSVSVPVADQDAAVRFYVEVLGFDLRQDVEVWPGARLVEVVPPGSDVGLVLLPSDSEIPMAVRMGTSDADAAFVRLRSAGAQLHNDHVIVDVKGAPPMFFFADPDGNGLVYLEEPQD